MNSQFNREMREIQYDIVRLGSRASELVEQSVQALSQMDAAAAKEAIERSDACKPDSQQIEDRLVRFLATRQPMASDLRLMLTGARVISDVERIAEHAGSVAKTVAKLSGRKSNMQMVRFPKMGTICADMIGRSMEAFLDLDTEKAEQVFHQDAQVDAMFRDIRAALINASDPSVTSNEQITYLILAARYLERIGDHASNIAQSIYYEATGLRL